LPMRHLGANVLSHPTRFLQRPLLVARGAETSAAAGTVKELEGLFTSNFEKIALYVAKHPDPDRRPGMEWVGIFRRR